MCMRCVVLVGVLYRARRFHVLLLPDSALSDERLPMRWRVYAELQRQGAGATWVPIHQDRLATLFGRQRDSIYRALRQLERGGYIQRRGRHIAGQRGVLHEARLNLSDGMSVTYTVTSRHA